MPLARGATPPQTLGYYDGQTMRTWWGHDDCDVTAWAPLVRPALPAEHLRVAPTY